MSNRVKIILKSGKDQSARRFHPWVFSGAIKKMNGEPSEGDVVEVMDNKMNLLGVGHYQPGSIAVRILDFNNSQIDSDFYSERLERAIELRRSLGLFNDRQTNMFRVVHAEGDWLPGLIIDWYDGVAVMQAHSVGIYKDREVIIDALKRVLGKDLTAIYDKSEGTIPYKSGIKPVNGYLYGTKSSHEPLENGYRFNVDWVGGQKTGFFLDQRDNRNLVRSFSEGRDVLNMFGYTGGFSVYAMGNAASVTTVDSSAKATDMADSNVRLNFPGDERHKAVATDAFDFLNNTDKNNYDLIILDPPAFAKHNNVLQNALQGYKRLNMRALQVIRTNGILFTFSCSQVVSRENFRKSVFAAAANTGRKVRILKQLVQPPDHPVNIYHPESEYLKGLVLHVE